MLNIEHTAPAAPLLPPPALAEPTARARCTFASPMASGIEAPPASAVDLPVDVAIGDWSDLFSAVKSRLRGSVGDCPALGKHPQPADAARRVQADVLQCVDALDQLHTTMDHEMARHRQLACDMFVLETALAHARAELDFTRSQELRTRHMASHDPLTSLPNRRCFRERLDNALAETHAGPRVFAVLYLDLDGFKLINDNHGHEVGDQVLRIVAARLSRAVRYDDTVGRLGGDEFGCLLVGLPDRAQLDHLVRKLFVALTAPLAVGELELSVRPSIGIAVCPADGGTTSVLLKRADAAMCRAKRLHSGHAYCGDAEP